MNSQDQQSTATLSIDDFVEQRSGPRDRVLLVAEFQVGDERLGPVRVRNISAGGLMAEHAEPLARGTPVAVEVNGLGWISGRIAWSAEGRVGVGFDHPVDPSKADKV